MNCKCGEPLEDWMDQCPVCEKPVIKELRCPNPSCNIVVKEHWKICPKCKTPLKTNISQTTLVADGVLDSKEKQKVLEKTESLSIPKEITDGLIAEMLGKSGAVDEEAEKAKAEKNRKELQKTIDSLLDGNIWDPVNKEKVLEKAQKLNIPEKKAKEQLEQTIEDKGLIILGEGLVNKVPYEVKTEITLLKGEYNVENDIRVNKTGKLVIEPGTKLIFNEGTGIISIGEIEAIGMPLDNIEFNGDKWNGIVLYENGTEGTFFKYCNFENGSGTYLSSKIIFDPFIEDNEFPNISTDNEITMGGAFNIFSAFLNIEDCYFGSNKTKLKGEGGAIYARNSILKIIGTSFNGNKSGWGGAIKSINSEIKIEDCSFNHNEATEVGGAIHTDFDCKIKIRESHFKQNRAKKGGGIFNDYDSKAIIENCVFLGNKAEEMGGAIFNGEDSNVKIENCEFKFSSYDTIYPPLGERVECPHCTRTTYGTIEASLLKGELVGTFSGTAADSKGKFKGIKRS